MNSLMEVLEEVNRLDYAEFDNPPEHRFSRRSRKALKKLLRPEPARRSIHWSRIPVRKRIVLVLLIVLLAAVGVTAGAVAIYGFKQERHREYTILRTVNADDCPKTIETVYYLPEIPEGYEFFRETSSEQRVYIGYINPDTSRCISFEQFVKDRYNYYFDTERQDFEELDINGHYALYLGSRDTNNTCGYIVWDNGDYILQIFGDFTKSELIDLAKSVKIIDN